MCKDMFGVILITRNKHSMCKDTCIFFRPHFFRSACSLFIRDGRSFLSRSVHYVYEIISRFTQTSVLLSNKCKGSQSERVRSQ